MHPSFLEDPVQYSDEIKLTEDDVGGIASYYEVPKPNRQKYKIKP